MMKKMNIWKRLSAMAVISALLVSMCGMTACATSKAALAEQQAILEAKKAATAAALAEQQEIMERKKAEAAVALAEKDDIQARKDAEAAAVLAEKIAILEAQGDDEAV